MLKHDAWGNWDAEIVGSNPSRGMNVCLLNVVCVCVYRWMPLRPADLFYRKIPPNVRH